MPVQSTDPRFTRVVVDGEALLLPSDDAWRTLDATPIVDGRRIGTGGILEHHRVLARRLAGLQVALAEERAPGKPWVVVHLAAVDGGFERVVVESASCLACGETVLVGVTRHYDLYVDTPDPLAAVRRHAADPLVACVRCGGTYDRPAVRVFAPTP